MTVSPWLVLAGALAALGLTAVLLGHLDNRQHTEQDEQATADDQFAALLATMERP
ncbi:hypothetical protein AB0O91_21125 [Kitasatospora sp. NPDC089797]|uniref:hypothetical protein n=1 Tax=Kitasatospora sp. NPDC089797 TaxID=3155298 RepID=UPI00342601FC